MSRPRKKMPPVGRPLERQDQLRGRGLPAPALAHQAQRLAATQDEVDAVDGLDRADRRLSRCRALQREMLGERSAPRGRSSLAPVGRDRRLRAAAPRRPRAVGQGRPSRRRENRPPGARRRAAPAAAVCRAPRLGHRAARREAAALRHVGEVRRLSLDRGQRLTPAAQGRQAIQEADRVGMSRPVEDVAGSAELDDPARVHHRDAIAEFRDDAEVVGDEDESEIRVSAECLSGA